MNKKEICITALTISILMFAILGIYFYKKNPRFRKQIRPYITHIVRSFTTSNTGLTYKSPQILSLEIHGIDVSHHQGKIKWDEIAHPDPTKKIDFVFIKASQTKKDKKFKKNWKQAKANHFSVGAYHYYNPDTKSSEQAVLFIKNVSLEKGDFPPIIDIEDLPKKQSKNEWRKGIKNWISIVEKHYGTKPIIYSGDVFYRDNLNVDAYFKSYPRLWIANYNKVEMPKSKWHFWQYSKKTKIFGIKGYVDMNVFYGNKAQLEALKIK